MKLEFFIAKRLYFTDKGKERVSIPAVRVAIAGIAVGLAVMILTIAIVLGFKKEVSEKAIGFGAHIGIYNLSTVVTGHNMAINRSMLMKYPAFSNKFNGWGMKDSFFASSLISNGCFVIPVLSSCVYHINHLPRSGSMEQKSKEAAKNFELYNQMLDEEWND